jgi:thioredoxin reductase (NADPH)
MDAAPGLSKTGPQHGPPAASPACIETDALVVGAGPVGLFQVFQLGLQDIRCHVVDTLPQPGGQCIELYPDKPIYDIPAVPLCTGRELVDRLLQQIHPFGVDLHLNQEVTELQRLSDGRYRVQTSAGRDFCCRTVFIAGGTGSFQPRRVKLPGIDRFERSQLFYSDAGPDQVAGRDLVVMGGADAAVATALQHARPGPARARSVTLVHRREQLAASVERLEELQALCEQQAMRFLVGQAQGFEEHAATLVALNVADTQGTVHRLPLDLLHVRQGLSPRLGPIAQWGLQLHHTQVVVDTAQFQTSLPGVFAVGDLCSYPGKRALILSGFHEATLAAFGAASLLRGGAEVPLLYTTSSSQLQRLLGVKPAPRV